MPSTNNGPRFYICSYSKYSEGAKLIANKLGAKIVTSGQTIVRPMDCLIYWGKTSSVMVRNNPDFVRICPAYFRSKKEFYLAGKALGLPVPEILTEQQAISHLNSGGKVLARSTMSGSGGEGIVVLRSVSDLTQEVKEKTKAYVKYIKKTHEYRIHVMDGEIIDVARKVKLQDREVGELGWEVRSHDNGFTFQKNNITVPEAVKKAAVDVCVALGLGFGGVDVVYNENNNTSVVLEVNTAPGIEGSTVTKYAEGFVKWYKRIKQGQ